jgi:hypothetical protein
VSDHLGHTLVERWRKKAHHATNLEDSHKAESTPIFSRAVTGPGHLNELVLDQKRHSVTTAKVRPLISDTVLTGGRLTLHFFKNPGSTRAE